MINGELTAVDLFCGCGGISCGLRRVGYRILAGVDNDKNSLNTYRLNFPEAQAVNCDLSELEPCDFTAHLGLMRGELDLLAGGPPCQGFSKNVPRRSRFLEDPKNRLVTAFVRFAEAAMPRFILMENVAEMKNGFEQAYTNALIETLEAIGYSVNSAVLNAPEYGVPQRRRRAFFLASRDGEKIAFPASTHGPASEAQNLFAREPYVSVWDSIGDLPPREHGEGSDSEEYSQEAFSAFQCWARDGSPKIRNHVARHLQPLQHERLRSLLAGQGLKDLPEAIRPKSGYSGAYGRLSREMIAPTITRWVFHPGSGRFGHPEQARVITIREAARIQAFPDSFVFTGTYIQQSHQVGNAVPPLLAEAVGRMLNE